MNKKQLHHAHTGLIKINLKYLLAFALIVSVICVFALRANNEHMIVLRNDVYTADKNDSNITKALQNLQAYVTAHMNTNLNDGNGSVYPPIQLKYTYQRLLGSYEVTQASDSQLYTDAQEYCQSTVPNGFSGRYRVPCIEQYITSHTTSAPNIPTALYEFDFVSPLWSPDLAGWTLLIAIASWLLLLTSWLYRTVLKMLSS